jgi:hypothetical protein
MCRTGTNEMSQFASSLSQPSGRRSRPPGASQASLDRPKPILPANQTAGRRSRMSFWGALTMIRSVSRARCHQLGWSWATGRGPLEG